MTILQEYTQLKLYIKDDETIQNQKIFDAIINFIKKEDICINIFIQKANYSIDENHSITADSIEVLSYNLYNIITFIGEKEDIEKIIKWIETECNNGILIIENPKIKFLNKLRRLITTKKITADKIMQREILTINETTCLNEILQLIYNKKVRFLPVIRKNSSEVIGIITEGDLIKKSLIPLKTKMFGFFDLNLNEFNKLLNDIKLNDRRTAKDLMISDTIYSILPDTKIESIILKMNKNKLKRILVIDNNKKLQGIISRLDIFKTLSEQSFICQPISNIKSENLNDISCEKELSNRSLKKFIDYNYESVTLNTTIEKIISKINVSEYTFIPVVDDNNTLKGIITDNEIFSFKHENNSQENLFKKLYDLFFNKTEFVNLNLNLKLTAQDIMKQINEHAMKETSAIESIINTMINNNLKMVLIMDENMKYKGVVSRRNIIRNLL